MKKITLRIEIPCKNKEAGFVGMEINMKESGSFGVEKMLKTALPEYKLGELVEGAKVTFLETEATEETDETFDNEASKMNLEDDKMIDEKELIRRALMGNQQAQAQCTEKGIKLPCPLCGKSDCVEIMDCYTAEGLNYECLEYRKKSFKCVCNCLKNGCGESTGVSETKQEALEKWNTRPAPPVGKCGECALWKEEKECPGSFCCTITGMERESNDFCSEFEPREE